MGACRHVFTTVQCIHDPSLSLKHSKQRVSKNYSRQGEQNAGEARRDRVAADQVWVKMKIAYENGKKSKSLLVSYLSNIQNEQQTKNKKADDSACEDLYYSCNKVYKNEGTDKLIIVSQQYYQRGNKTEQIAKNGNDHLLHFIILFMDGRQIVTIIQRPFQQRSHHEHTLLTELIMATIPHCAHQQARNISFFIEVYSPGTQISVGSLLLVEDTPSSFRSLYYHKQTVHAGLVLIINCEGLLKSAEISSSIEDQAKWLQRCECFSEVPRKRLYQVLHHARPLLLTYGQCIPLSSGQQFFFIRKGEFCYEFTALDDCHAQVLSFKSGHLFTPNNDFKVYSQDDFPEFQKKKRYQVRCKSSRGLVFVFAREFFASQMLRYCQEKLQQSGERLEALLEERVVHVGNIRRANSQLLTQPVRRSASGELQALVAAKVSSSRKGSTHHQPERIKDISEKSYDYRTLKQQRAPRNHIFSKSELAQLSTNPQQNQSDLLLWKKAKCLRLRQISKHSHPPLPKAETMLRFIKATVQFQKVRRKPSIL